MLFANLRTIAISFFRFLGLLVFYFSKKRKPIALCNVNRCFFVKKDKDKKRNQKIIRDSFISLGHALADFLLLRFYNKKNIDKYIEVKNKNYFEQAFAKNNGVIISGAHFGSWELAAHYFALNGMKSLILYNPIKKPLWLEKWVKNNRQISGNTLISKQNSLLKIYKHLKRGGIVSFVTDQHCIKREGIKIKFFNNDVWMHKSFIQLSLKTGAPIISCFIYTQGLNKYVLQFCKPIYPDYYLNFSDALSQMAVQNNKFLEQAILKSPDHWMWQHRRFKSKKQKEGCL